MNDNERVEMEKEIDSYNGWMENSSGHQVKDINDLLEDDGDIYDVFVEIELVNGKKIKLKNHCKESFDKQFYAGDAMMVVDNLLNITRYDDEDCHHQITIPLSSVCCIDGYSKRIDWKAYDEERKDISPKNTKKAKEIDWEQRRYEIAKDFLAGMFAGQIEYVTIDGVKTKLWDAAVWYADAMIYTLQNQIQLETTK